MKEASEAQIAAPSLQLRPGEHTPSMSPPPFNPSVGGGADAGAGFQPSPVQMSTDHPIQRQCDPETHVVQSGETIYRLAQRFGVTRQALIDANPGTVQYWNGEPGFRVGDTIQIPCGDSTTGTGDTDSTDTTTDTTTDMAADTETETDPLANLDEDYLDPLLNSNTTYQNIVLLIQQWEALDGTNDDRKLAYILSTTEHETGGTMHGIHEGFSDGYWPGRYADSGYWGRGFVQLTWEDNYSGAEDETGLDLSQYEEAALLPVISAIVTVDGMLTGDFTGRNLNQYLPVTQEEGQDPVVGASDWDGARYTVNGQAAAGPIGDEGEAIYNSIQTYRAGVAAGTITQTLAEYLYLETTHFTGGRNSDANRVLNALNYFEFDAPSFGSDITEQQQNYVDDIEETGYPFWIDDAPDTAALSRFQTDFNAAHNLEMPLRTDGILDDPTFEALMRLGNLIQSGEAMIDYAFDGAVEATNPVVQAFDEYAAGTRDLPALAARLAQLMPVPTATDVTEGLTADLAFQLSLAAPSHDDLAYFNREILEAMRTLLQASSDPQHQIMGQRIQCMFDYEAPTANNEHIEYTVVSGDTMGRIAERNNTTVAEIQAYNAAHGNPIPNANTIGIGDVILFPNPEYDPDATTDTPTCELDAFPLPDLPAPTDSGSTGGGGGNDSGANSAHHSDGDTQSMVEAVTDWFMSWF